MSSTRTPATPPASPRDTRSLRAPALTGSSGACRSLASLFECLVCTDYAQPPVPQCESDHLVCSRCRPNLSRCPACRAPPGDVRNPAPEQVARAVLFPCAHASWGCALSLPAADKAAHERLCEFRPQPCPCPGAACAWRGPLDAVVPHLKWQHESVATLQGDDIVFLATDVHLPRAHNWVMLQSCFGFHFVLALMKIQSDGLQQLFATVQLVGTRQQAKRFTCRLELTGGDGRRLTWEAKPQSIREGLFTAIRNRDCLTLDFSMAQYFTVNGRLGINVTISKC